MNDDPLSRSHADASIEAERLAAFVKPSLEPP